MTFAVVFLLILAGPSSAFIVNLNISGSSQVEKGAEISFIADLNIEDQERVPIQEILLTIQGVKSINCTFYPDASIKSGCDDIKDIDLIFSDAPYTFGNNSFNNSGNNYGFGYGYGYGYGYGSSSNYNLRYNITLNTSSFNAALLNYTAKLYAIVGGNTGIESLPSSNVEFNIKFDADIEQVVPEEENVLINDTVDEIIFLVGTGIENITIDSSVNESKEITLNFSEIPGDIELTSDLLLSRSNYKVELSANTVISSSDPSWDKVIILPTLRDASSYDAPSGSADVVIKVGGEGNIIFSQPVKITLPAMTGKSASFANSGNTLTKISLQCNSATDASNIIGNGECYWDDGTDMIIWTKHFTYFAAYTPTSTTTTSGSNGRTSGSSSNTVFIDEPVTPLKDYRLGKESTTSVEAPEEQTELQIQNDALPPEVEQQVSPITGKVIGDLPAPLSWAQVLTALIIFAFIGLVIVGVVKIVKPKRPQY